MQIPARKIRTPGSLAGATRLSWVVVLAGLLPAQLLAPAAAEAGSVGLSSVRGATIPNFVLADNPVESSDRFGFSFAAGDFNGDGASDLATGVPHDWLGVGGVTPNGSVYVQLGAVGEGPSAVSPSVLLSDASGGHFGWALAAGDFNGDAIDDLAVGSPEGIVGFGNRYGLVRIYYGSATPEVFGEGVYVSTVGVAQEARTGFALAAGNFNGDGFDDLAIASPALNTNAGAIRIAYGGASGLAVPGTVIDQDTPGVEDTREAQDLFGYSLAAGDFDGNGGDDLAVGVVNENQVGFVQVLFSTASGIDPALDLLLSQDAVAGNGELNDQFGFALAAADFDGDGKDDLAIGSPGEALGGSNEITNTGMVVVVYGSTSASFDLAHTQAWGQGGILGVDTAEIGDRFGAALAAGDFDADGYADLAIGQPEEDVTGTNDGALTVHMGGPNGFSQLRARFLAAGTDGLSGPIQAHSNYGFAAASGDFDGDGSADLVIGAPYHNQDGTILDSGLEVILYGGLYCDGFEDAAPGYWSSVVP
jgi:hypothetical protein